jgi:hypothetical protein
MGGPRAVPSGSTRTIQRRSSGCGWDGLKPATTYYYKATSMGHDGVSDGVESSVDHFTTAAPGVR